MANPFAAQTELLILRLLSEEPKGMYGLELVKASDGKLRRGSVYVTLGRMQEKGLVVERTTADSVHSGLPRPQYRLTAHGQKVLEAADLIGWSPARV
jgi:DNA-binding PadR family transcriptional regulator